jgi:hypothetical protein
MFALSASAVLSAALLGAAAQGSSPSSTPLSYRALAPPGPVVAKPVVPVKTATGSPTPAEVGVVAHPPLLFLPVPNTVEADQAQTYTQDEAAAQARLVAYLNAQYAAQQAKIQAQQAAAVAAAPVVYNDPTPVVTSNSAMQNIFDRESGDSPYSINSSSGACGLGQADPCSKLLDVCGSLSNVGCQLSFFTEYANERYGGWANAWLFWESHSWW